MRRGNGIRIAIAAAALLSVVAAVSGEPARKAATRRITGRCETLRRRLAEGAGR